MNIKSLLLGSAAALAAVSGAQAADAIIAAEPEPMEYVRVCDAFGTGYFYIPGTETCLKIGGYVRFQVDFDSRDGAYADDNWDAWTRGRVDFTAKSDTELGELTGFIAIQAEASDYPAATGSTGDFYFDEVYLQLGGFKAGTYLNWWDKGINGETDSLGATTRMTSIAYIYTGDAFTAGLQLDELTNVELGGGGGQDFGLEAIVTASLGAASVDLLGSYDFANEDGAVRALVSAGIGPGTLQLAGVWASGYNVYYNASEWTIAASYSFKATDKFTITPGVQYFSNVDLDGDDFDGDDAWRAGLTVDYAITSGLAMKVSAQWNDGNRRGAGDEDYWDGFVRLQRSF
ncbi:putative outer membrane protein y4fJ precursor [Pseudorhizobium banfieldiae]|uniref:Porin n=1 Tax=Pseudorhizobium banfieldiae TaxID=1125847 RepID=L0NCK4_9HYPH|nr:porin [Pseudorhizobium banfieldiae]CAD6603691.1 porin [arsenite-oxidising bacterium NT-25]CCF18780.1 putative outer membrane protein y4fJ precursor [Pseudorhizobium banfieldiae]